MLATDSDTDIREFAFETSPWCNNAYKDSKVVRVYSDRDGVRSLIIECDSRGTIYMAAGLRLWVKRKGYFG